MKYLKFWIVVGVEWLDQWVIGHRMYGTVCMWLGTTDWWGDRGYPFRNRR